MDEHNSKTKTKRKRKKSKNIFEVQQTATPHETNQPTSFGQHVETFEIRFFRFRNTPTSLSLSLPFSLLIKIIH